MSGQGCWQPIESAPKDGHRMLLTGVNEGVRWIDIGSWWPLPGAWSDDDDGEGKIHPTHWQPLPEPPQ